MVLRAADRSLAQNGNKQAGPAKSQLPAARTAIATASITWTAAPASRVLRRLPAQKCWLAWPLECQLAQRPDLLSPCREHLRRASASPRSTRNQGSGQTAAMSPRRPLGPDFRSGRPPTESSSLVRAAPGPPHAPSFVRMPQRRQGCVTWPLVLRSASGEVASANFCNAVTERHDRLVDRGLLLADRRGTDVGTPRPASASARSFAQMTDTSCSAPRRSIGGPRHARALTSREPIPVLSGDRDRLAAAQERQHAIGRCAGRTRFTMRGAAVGGWILVGPGGGYRELQSGSNSETSGVAVIAVGTPLPSAFAT